MAGARADCRQHIDRARSTHLQQVWLDALVFDREQLDFLVRIHGADRLCLGSDYPFDMAGFLTRDRPSWLRFLGFDLGAVTPDENTIPTAGRGSTSPFPASGIKAAW